MIIVLIIVAVPIGLWLAYRLFGSDREPSYEGPQVRPIQVPGRTVFFDEREFFAREIGPIDAPTLVLAHGWSFDGEMNFFSIIPDRDEVVPVRAQRDLAARLADPVVIEIEDAGHASVLSRPEVYVKAIDEFLDG